MLADIVVEMEAQEVMLQPATRTPLQPIHPEIQTHNEPRTT